MHFGYKVLNEESVKAPKSKIKAKDRPGEKYETSRWTPLLQDIAEVLTHYFHVLYEENNFCDPDEIQKALCPCSLISNPYCQLSKIREPGDEARCMSVAGYINYIC